MSSIQANALELILMWKNSSKFYDKLSVKHRKSKVIMNKPHQRKGARSNAHVGRDFELAAQSFFSAQGLSLDLNIKVPVGIGYQKKAHAFDLGCLDKKILVECKSHKWTAPNDNVPSAKLTV